MRRLRSLLLLSLAGSALACGSSGKGGGSGGAGAGSNGAAGSGAGGSAGTSAGGAGTAGSGTAGSGASGSGAAGSGAGTAGSGGGAGATGAAGTGAAGRDAGAGNPDAGDGGGAQTGGASKCANGTYLLCESFEGTAVGAIPTGWTRQVQGGDNTLVAVDDKEAARGTHALKLGAVANGPRRIVHPAMPFGAGFWGRIYYKVQIPAPKINGYLHSTMVALVGQNPQGTGSEEVRVVDTVQDPNGKHQFIYNVQPNGAEFGTGSSYNYMYDSAWHCAEWHIDATNQSYHFYFDGKEITQIAKMNGAGNLKDTGIPQLFESIEVGWYNYQSAPPGFVAWIDEVAVDTARIGCSN